MIVKKCILERKFNYDVVYDVWYSFLYIIRKGKKSFINDSLIIIKKNDVQFIYYKLIIDDW